jgi:hypothetical protein
MLPAKFVLIVLYSKAKLMPPLVAAHYLQASKWLAKAGALLGRKRLNFLRKYPLRGPIRGPFFIALQ